MICDAYEKIHIDLRLVAVFCYRYLIYLREISTLVKLLSTYFNIYKFV